MTIKEIELRSGMDRSNIRFYEKEGLLSPRYLDNGYRDYTEDDLALLLRIKLLRSLHVSLADIRSLLQGNISLTDILNTQITKLEHELQDTSYALQLCLSMKEDDVSFTDLNAQKYLDGISTLTSERSTSYFTIPADRLSQANDPWRRFFARAFDMYLYHVLWIALRVFLFQTPTIVRSNSERIADLFMVTVMMLLIEPLWLRFLATTPGKAVFGLSLYSADGHKLRYEQGFARTWQVFVSGMGLYVPIYQLYRLWRSFDTCSSNEVLKWDHDLNYQLRDTKIYRYAVYAIGHICLVAVLYNIDAWQYLPRHQGPLTIEQFAANYNYYIYLLQYNFGNQYLDENGEWFTDNSYGNFAISLREDPPALVYELEDGLISKVSFLIENTQDDIFTHTRTPEAMLLALSFSGSKQTQSFFSKVPKTIMKQIASHPFENFEFELAGITYASHIESQGYILSDPYLIPDDTTSEKQLRISFTASR